MATIGPRDGAEYTLLGVRNETRTASQWGFGDLSVPTGGVFRIETRAFKKWVNGERLHS